MSIKLIKPSDPLPERNVVIVLYAQPGTSKTSLAFTSEAPILLDFDNGVERSVGRKDTIKIDSWNDVIELQAGNLFAENGYKTVIIDTCGTCLDNYIAEYCMKMDFKNKKSGGGLSLAGYGALKDTFAPFVKSLKGMDVILIAHAQEKEASGDRTIVRPKMTGGSYDTIMGLADMVGYMDIQNGKRILNFNPTEMSVGKNSAELPRMELPGYDRKDWADYMANIIAKVKGKMYAHTEEQAAAAAQFDSLKKRISELVTPDDMQVFSEVVAEQPAVYMVQLKKILGDRMKVMGIIYDKTIPGFVFAKKDAAGPVDQDGNPPVKATVPISAVTSKLKAGKQVKLRSEELAEKSKGITQDLTGNV